MNDGDDDNDHGDGDEDGGDDDDDDRGKTLIESGGGVLGQKIWNQKWISAKNLSWEYFLVISMMRRMMTIRMI